MQCRKRVAPVRWPESLVGKIHIMKISHTLGLLLAATLLFGCKSTPPQSKASNSGSKVTFVVSCSEPTMGIMGTIVCDGLTNQVSGTGGGTFRATGYDIVASFKKSGAAGRMSVSASDSAGNSNTATTDKPSGSVRSEFHGQPLFQHVATAL